MADPSSVCYTISSFFVSSSNQYFPCGKSPMDGASAQACCFGSDSCVQDGICNYQRSGVVNGTGFYMAGCTDPTWQDPACPKQCAAHYSSDVIYNPPENHWNCCQSREGYMNCQEPSDLVVQAPAPLVLSTLALISSVAPLTPLTTGISTVSIAYTPMTSSSAPANTHASPTSHAGTAFSPQDPAPSSLSVGAKVGISIAAILGILLLFGAGFFCYRRKKRRLDNFKTFNDADSQFSVRNRSHSVTTASSLAATQASRATGWDTNRNTFASRTSAANSPAASSVYNTSRNTLANSIYANRPDSSHLPQVRTATPTPSMRFAEAADGLQVVKQLPQTPDDLVFAQNREKGPFEMQVESIEMQEQQRPLSVQELEGTVVTRAELDAMDAPIEVGIGRLVEIGPKRFVDIGEIRLEDEDDDEGEEEEEEEDAGRGEMSGGDKAWDRGSIQQSRAQSMQDPT